ncbi:hypothetical protein PJ747_004591 [Escherichia coli]|nr:hypothetical protein [Escherichia coli]
MPLPDFEDDDLFFPEGVGFIHDNTMDNPDLIELGLHPHPKEVRKPVRAYLKKGDELGKIYYHAGNKIDNLTELGPKKLRLFLLENIHHYCTTVDSWLTLLDICSWFSTQDMPERQVLIKMLDELDDTGYVKTKRVVDNYGRPRIMYSSTSWTRNALPLDRLFKGYYTDVRALRQEREILEYLDRLTKRKGLKIKPLHGDVLYYMILCAVWVCMGITDSKYYTRTGTQISVALGITERTARKIFSGLYQAGLLDRISLNGKDYAYGVNTDLFYKESDAPAILKEMVFKGDKDIALAYREKYGKCCEKISPRFLYGELPEKDTPEYQVDKGEQEEDL